jgi:FAD binding domain/Cysteine-rich domain
VAGVLAVASERAVPVIPRGAGSNLSAGTIAQRGGIMLALTRMKRLLELDADNLVAVCEPGLPCAEVGAAAAEHGLLYPPDPGSRTTSTIGGNVAENAGGMRGLKYGVTRDYVLGCEAVLATGEVIRAGGKLVKDVAGYDLVRLLCGSEGTPAVLTELTMALVPAPEASSALIRRVAEYVELPSAGECCGAAGTYSMLRPADSARILDDKLDQIEAAGVDAVVAVNPGCLRQLQTGLRRRGSKVRAVHLAELLADHQADPGAP